MKKQLIKEAFRLQQLAGIAPINEILPSSNTPRRKGLQKEQNGATKTYYTVNRYGVTEIVPYKSLGFDGSEQWEELSGFDSNIIKKYYTDNDGTGKVVVNANTSEDEMLADLERIDDDMWMESAKPGMQKEYISSHEESITEAFQKAGIDLNLPVVYIVDYGSSTDDPKKVLGSALLQELENERAQYEEDDEDFNEAEGVQYEYAPAQGVGELAGDEEAMTQGLTCKLLVFFSDSQLYEIWQ